MIEEKIAQTDMQRTLNNIVTAGAVISINADIIYTNYIDKADVLVARPYTGKKYSTQHYFYWTIFYEVGFDQADSPAIRIFKMEIFQHCSQEKICFINQHGIYCTVEKVNRNNCSYLQVRNDWLEHKKGREAFFSQLYKRHRNDALNEVMLLEKEL